MEINDNNQKIYKEDENVPEGYTQATTYDVKTITASTYFKGNQPVCPFEKCKTVNIPKSITHISESLNLYVKKFTVDVENSNFSSDDTGVLFYKGKTKLIRFPVVVTRHIEYLIPDTVDTIDRGAFAMGNETATVVTTDYDIDIIFTNKKIKSASAIFRRGKYHIIDARYLQTDSIESMLAIATFDTIISPESMTDVSFNAADEIKTIKFSKNVTHFCDSAIEALGKV